MTRFLTFCFALTYSFGLLGQVFFADTPCLTPDAQTVIFSYDSDLWQVSADGGMASRVTAMDGNETNPRISPDGKYLAFTGTQYGTADIYAMPLAGGPIQQLTYNEANDKMEAWSWDSKSIYFNTNRENEGTSYTVSIDGGTPHRVFSHYFNRDHNVATHPDGRLFFNESWESATFLHRKRYKGAFNPEIRSYDLKNKSYVTHTNYDGKDVQPTIDKAGTIYFSSDRANGEYNLYKLENGNAVQLTDFSSSIYHPQVSADGSAIVFRKDYQLYIFDTATGNSRKLDIQIAQNNTIEKEQDFTLQNNIEYFDVSVDGKKLALVSRGELFVSDVKGKFVQQIKTNPLGRVLEAHWLEDDATIIFNQTLKGYQNWYTVKADGTEAAKQFTSDESNNRNLAFNSDRTQAVYFSGRNEIRLIDLEEKTNKTIATDELWGFYNTVPQWAPDDKHVVYTAYRDFESDIFLLNTETAEPTNLTQSGITETAPSITDDGKYLYLVSNRTQPSYPFGLQDPKIFRIPLQKYDQPFRKEKFDQLFGEEEEDESSDSDTTATEKPKIELTIDFEEMNKRLEQLGPRFGSQGDFYIIQKEEVTTLLFTSNHDEGKFSIWKNVYEPFEDVKNEKITSPNTYGLFIKEADGQIYTLIQGNIYTLNINANSTEKIDIDYTFERVLRDEFEQMFDETWANLEENFYNENFHGVNWKAMKEKYKSYLPNVQSRDHLRKLLNDLLGELNTSHFGFYSNGNEEGTHYGTRTNGLGLEYEADRPYTIKRIIKDGPVDRLEKDIQAGDQIVAINNVGVDPTTNRNKYLSKASIKPEMTITLLRNGEEHDVILHPTSIWSERTLLYDEWQDGRQEYVDSRTDKKIAHVHMKNMTQGQLNSFLEDMVTEWYNSDALILDLRNNRGGNVHDKVLQFLSQRPYANWKYREGALAQQPNFGVSAKPMVLLINEQSLSDAEVTSAGFKELGLGTIIGTETYRWIIFTSGKGLVDGSFYRLPSWGCYTLDGDNLELTGVSPDIYVKNTFDDRLNGRDPQLDKAIEVILEELR